MPEKRAAKPKKKASKPSRKASKPARTSQGERARRGRGKRDRTAVTSGTAIRNYYDVTLGDVADLTLWFCHEISYFLVKGRLRSEADERIRQDYVTSDLSQFRFSFIPLIEGRAEMLELFAESQGIPGTPIRVIAAEILRRRTDRQDRKNRDRLSTKVQDAIDTANRVFARLRFALYGQGRNWNFPAFPALASDRAKRRKPHNEFHVIGFHRVISLEQASAGPIPAVELGQPQDLPKVFGKPKPRLTLKQYAFVKLLLAAWPTRLGTSDLEEGSSEWRSGGFTEPAKEFRKLRSCDPDWERAIKMAGRPRGGYGIANWACKTLPE